MNAALRSLRTSRRNVSSVMGPVSRTVLTSVIFIVVTRTFAALAWIFGLCLLYSQFNTHNVHRIFLAFFRCVSFLVVVKDHEGVPTLLDLRCRELKAKRLMLGNVMCVWTGREYQRIRRLCMEVRPGTIETDAEIGSGRFPFKHHLHC